MDWLIPVAVLLASIALVAVRDRRATRRRRAAAAGGAVRFRGVLALAEGRFRRGTVRLERPHVQWSPRRAAALPLSGAEVLAVSSPDGLRAARADDLLVRLRLPTGTLARLLVHKEDAATVVGALRTELAPPGLAPAPPTAAVDIAGPKRPAWAVACVVIAAVWLLGWVWLVVAGEARTATVTGGDGEGLCTVVWTGSDGRGHHAEVDCDDEPAGSHLRVWALGPPFVGEAVDPEWTLGAVPVLGLGVAAPGVYRLVRGPRAEPPWEAPADDVESVSSLPPLQQVAVEPSNEPAADRLARLAPYAAQQRIGLTWEDPRTPAGSRGRSAWRDAGRATLMPAMLLVTVGLLTAPWPYRWYVLHTSPTASALAVSTGEEALHGPGPVPDDITVRFRTLDGEQVQADVGTTRELPKGTEVTVVYAQDKPGWARRDDSADGLDRGVGLAAAAALLILGWLSLRLLRIRLRAGAVTAALGEPGRPGLALLTADPGGDPLLLVTDPVVTPTTVTTVSLQRPLPLGAAASFAADRAREVRVHGRLSQGSAVVVQLDGHWLLPAYPAFQPESEDLLFLLDSTSALVDAQPIDPDPDSNAHKHAPDEAALPPGHQRD